ncbi:GAF domain-containing sensor histidine kinase [Mucilaginibacter jinjuensis]|uniref:histidine kinase n=1 Tax=Mucilaginibacter jinjuensis TaxID=1176721 RepID=A0ABY7TF58_9SPHI|nr:histidine kinase dimerization/phospho-acceptor domain-containing protein [Mucilaginibacter jinjuensis]WCT14247.1 histidine kinase dimerization/phospho-acceptor domain-containing protein [Mucilaginibacter jinjuensis]
MRRRDRVAGNPVVTEANVTFYACVPLINEDGLALGTLGVLDQKSHEFSAEQADALKALAKQVVDKIELRRKVSTLQQTNQELISANVLIQKFASMAAHDIKNPLSSIKLTSQALRMRPEIREHESCLRLVNLNITATDNLLVLVDEMMAYSKNPTLLLEKKRDFDLNTLINKVLGLLVVPDDVKLIGPESRYTIHYCIIAFEQILMNLISNAIRYNYKTECIITIDFPKTTGIIWR